MKKGLFLALACLVTIWQSLSADCCLYDDCDFCDDYDCYSDCSGFDSVLTFDVGGGYRRDNLKWKVFPSYIPGRRIEQKWENIGIGVVEANAQLLICEHFLFKGYFDYGLFSNSGTQKFFSHGPNDNRFFRARPRGNVCDVSGGLGYQFNWDRLRLSFAPLAGYSYHQQKFKGRTYRDLLLLFADDILAHNNYRFRWSGPWVGFALAIQATCELQLYFDYSYHWSRFRGTVKEHFFVGQFADHLRSNRAYGNEFQVGGIYTFCDLWYIGIKFDYKQFCGNKGKSRLQKLHISSPVRNIDWNSSLITMDIGYTF